MSSGAKVISAFIRETVAGTTPASGAWSLLKRTSWGVKPTQNKGENNEIGGSRMAQGATPGTVDVGGDVGTKFRWGQHDDFLASCFGAEWSGDSLTMGNERITFSLATYASDAGLSAPPAACRSRPLDIRKETAGRRPKSNWYCAVTSKFWVLFATA